MLIDKPGFYVMEAENKSEYVSPLKTTMAACIGMAKCGDDYELTLFSSMERVIDYYKSGQIVEMINGYYQNYRKDNSMNLSQIIIGLKIPDSGICDLEMIVDKLKTADISLVVCYDIDLTRSIACAVSEAKLEMMVTDYRR